ncbi:lysophospholipid acyltransferase family protein [uncultured Cohaesibacter sp.]|uniref:lysophospholipid acyltransferase family protein n=1 Tax=uncultured Cohaesibacter sp. TaxID=1002546 RepID=UPI0029C6B49F|nr:lysophospholipid acyltransferase family protein [uncultured Cohaesibacter sp.]
MLLIRSLLFHIAFYSVTFVLVLACMFTLPFHRRHVIAISGIWGRVCTWLFSKIVGGSFEVRHQERIPRDQSLILACKHMSVYETFALLTIIDDPLFILKRELMWIPLFGWAVARGEMIPIDRGARSKTLKSMMQRAKERMKETRQLIIFPEGTRRPVDAEPAYKYGIAYIYKELNVPCYPVAINTGLFWPRQSVLLYPGKVIFEVLPPIEPGLEQAAFFEQVSTMIEENSNRLIAEARAAGGGLPKQ